MGLFKAILGYKALVGAEEQRKRDIVLQFMQDMEENEKVGRTYLDEKPLLFTQESATNEIMEQVDHIAHLVFGNEITRTSYHEPSQMCCFDITYKFMPKNKKSLNTPKHKMEFVAERGLLSVSVTNMEKKMYCPSFNNAEKPTTYSVYAPEEVTEYLLKVKGDFEKNTAKFYTEEEIRNGAF